jgi:hypothetical protein
MRTALILFFFLSLYCFAQAEETIVLTAPAHTEVVVETSETGQYHPHHHHHIQDQSQTTTQESTPPAAQSQSGTTQASATPQAPTQPQVDQFGLTANERELFRKFELKKIEDKISLKLAKLRAKVEGKHAPSPYYQYSAQHQHPSVPHEHNLHHQFHHCRHQQHVHQDTADPAAHTHVQDQHPAHSQDQQAPQQQQQQGGFYGSIQLTAEEQQLYEKFIDFENHQQLETRRQEEVAKLLKKEAKKQNVDLESAEGQGKKQKNQKKDKKQKKKGKEGKGKGGKKGKK